MMNIKNKIQNKNMNHESDNYYNNTNINKSRSNTLINNDYYSLNTEHRKNTTITKRNIWIWRA